MWVTQLTIYSYSPPSPCLAWCLKFLLLRDILFWTLLQECHLKMQRALYIFFFILTLKLQCANP